MAQDPEVLKVQPSDNPRMSLVSVPLDGNNFLSWSRSVRIALGVKMKLSFINGKETNLKKQTNLMNNGLWDELICFKPMPQCSCGASKTMSDTNNEDQLKQFLMGLNDPYDVVRNQILMQEPLPSVSKAYSMILRVEKQREVHSGFPSSGQNMAMQARGNIFRRPGNATAFQKRKTAAERRNQLCEHCGKTGHTKEVCFEIHGYPDWYRNLLEQRRRDGASTSRTYNVTSNEEYAQNTLDEIGISEIIRNEIQRYMGDAKSAVTGTEDYQEFSDGTKHPVKKIGEVPLSPTLLLNKVLFVPDLKYNLLSDHKIKKIVGIGRLIGRLYVLDDMSFSEKVVSQWLNTEPRNYNQASQQEEWQRAMQNEIAALKRNQTWDIVPLPKDKKAIGCRWIYKLKTKADGSIERHKARLVAKGYNQVPGIDYVDSFSPVAKSVTVIIFLAVAAALQWHVHQLDINNTFLHGHLDEEIYTSRRLPSSTRSAQGLILTQTKYIKDLVSDTGLSNARATTTSLPTGIKFSADAGNPIAEPEVDRRLVGRLLYLGYSKPDISHASQQLSQFLQTPCQQHWDAAMHLVKYLKGTPYKGLFFPTDNTLS
ncbi:UNVERIFIED_CONTAM: Retrovirus-related Pol polyprotein from transposon RE2 [Sesamum radiatum]|uniref:Retrovirus-related Pol polyprotein from transposon RE2 n=1 Tax=Sesamum radiatum TaxID=300843 RepID=A0AAW2PHJ8_SESRA